MKRFLAWLMGLASSLALLGFAGELLLWAWRPNFRSLREGGAFLLIALLTYGVRKELQKGP